MKRYNKFRFILVCLRCRKFTELSDKDLGANKKFIVKNIYKDSLDSFFCKHLTCGCIECISDADIRFKDIYDPYAGSGLYSYQD